MPANPPPGSFCSLCRWPNLGLFLWLTLVPSVPAEKVMILLPAVFGRRQQLVVQRLESRSQLRLALRL